LDADSSTSNDFQGARLFAFIVLAALAVAVPIAVLVLQPHNSHSGKSPHHPHDLVKNTPTTLTAAQNLTRARIRELVNQWQDDTSSYSVEPGTITFGDLNGGGKSDAVAVVGWSGGGTGYFECLIAVINKDGSITNTPRFDLGDRVKINSIKIRNRVITVDMLTQGPNDGMCCPTERRVINVIVDATKTQPILTLLNPQSGSAPPA
jgi:hypothetical protein